MRHPGCQGPQMEEAGLSHGKRPGCRAEKQRPPSGCGEVALPSPAALVLCWSSKTQHTILRTPHPTASRKSGRTRGHGHEVSRARARASYSVAWFGRALDVKAKRCPRPVQCMPSSPRVSWWPRYALVRLTSPGLTSFFCLPTTG
jgi:hypothetical protein